MESSMKTATTNARSRAPSLVTLRGNLVFERAKKELSQAALAEAAGLTRQTISDIERGAANPTVDVLDRIVTVLGIGLDQLFVAKPSGQKLDASEIRRRRASAKAGDTVDAFVFLDAVDEAAGRPSRGFAAKRRR